MYLNYYHMEFGIDGLPMMVKEKETYYVDGRISFDTPLKMVNLAKAINLDKMCEEYLYAFYFTSKMKLIGLIEISHGIIDSSPASPREIYQKALMLGAKQIAIIHNHPSGDITPSKADYQVTEKIRDAGKIIDIPLVDSLIISSDSYYSFCESGYF